jgi:hypothetical protein
MVFRGCIQTIRHVPRTGFLRTFHETSLHCGCLPFPSTSEYSQCFHPRASIHSPYTVDVHLPFGKGALFGGKDTITIKSLMEPRWFANR